MANNKNNINDSGLRKLCSFITLAATQGNIIDNLNIADDKVFSSKRVKDLIDNASEQDRLYVDKIISNLNKLSSKVVTTIPDSSTGEPNTLCLYSATGTAPFHQYIVLSDKTVIDLGSTDISLDNYLTEEEISNIYLKQADSHTHTNKSALDNITQENLDKIAEVDDKVDKSNITTTIDSTSTDDQVPGALTTYKALDDKNIYHFSSPTEGDANTLVIKGKSAHYQISNAVITSGTIANLPPNIGVGGLLISHGLATVHQFFLTHNNRVYKRYGYWANTTDTEPTWVGTWERVISEGDLNRTVNGNGDIRIEIPANADMNNYTAAGFYKVLSGSNAITIANLPINNACLINIYGNSNSATGWMVQEIIADNSIINNRYIRYKIQNNADWSPWEKIVTTRVEDVGWKSLTMGSGMNGSMQYRVKNGICYVTVTALSSPTMSTHSQTITSNLPIPEAPGSWYVLAANNITQGSILITIDGTGKMVNHVGVNNATYYGFFSYPVAES